MSDIGEIVGAVSGDEALQSRLRREASAGATAEALCEMLAEAGIRAQPEDVA